MPELIVNPWNKSYPMVCCKPAKNQAAASFPEGKLEHRAYSVACGSGAGYLMTFRPVSLRITA